MGEQANAVTAIPGRPLPPSGAQPTETRHATIDANAGPQPIRHGTTDLVTDIRAPPATEQSTNECHTIVESTDSGPDLCTIYSTASEDSLVTAWISAREGSYCALEDVR